MKQQIEDRNINGPIIRTSLELLDSLKELLALEMTEQNKKLFVYVANEVVSIVSRAKGEEQ